MLEYTFACHHLACNHLAASCRRLHLLQNLRKTCSSTVLNGRLLQWCFPAEIQAKIQPEIQAEMQAKMQAEM